MAEVLNRYFYHMLRLVPSYPKKPLHHECKGPVDTRCQNNTAQV